MKTNPQQTKILKEAGFKLVSESKFSNTWDRKDLRICIDKEDEISLKDLVRRVALQACVNQRRLSEVKFGTVLY